ncbi:glycosyltransferase family 9 protein [uncultured Fibrella sp.]|uniref:glycosyltransferase family 9 protein n=1 Tax=uncultured Fibrella sp. TaxID=1284596 RepID=UPI0035CB050B
MDKLTQALGHPPRTIALFRAIKLGDLLCTVPTFRALRQAFPDAHIALISLPWAHEFVTAYRDCIDEFIAFPGWPGLPEQPVDPAQVVAFLSDMQVRRWDVVMQLQGNGTLVNAMLSLVGGKVLAGYFMPDIPSERWAEQAGLFMQYPAPSHEIHRHLSLMTYLGIADQGTETTFSINHADEERTWQLLTASELEPHGYVCIHAGGISGRRWPAYQFAAVADELARQGYQIVLTGTIAEQPIIYEVKSLMIRPAISLAGQTSLGVLASLLNQAALLVSNDTGVAHLAIASQTPSVVIYTSADPAEWGPLNRDRHRVVRESNPNVYEQVLREAATLLASQTGKGETRVK